MRYPSELPPQPENVDAAVNPFGSNARISVIDGTRYGGFTLVRLPGPLIGAFWAPIIGLNLIIERRKVLRRDRIILRLR